MNSDNPLEKYDQREAIEKFANAPGRAFIPAAEAMALLAPFGDDVTQAFKDRYGDQDAHFALAEAIKSYVSLAGDVPGCMAAPYQSVVTHSDASYILAEAIGEEPATSQKLGRGSAADESHNGNVETISARYAAGCK